MADIITKAKHYKLLTHDTSHPLWHQPSGLQCSVLHSRLVYSYLAHRARLDHGASARDICRETTLHPTTGAAVLTDLAGVGLITKRGKEWIAVEPPEGLFIMRQADQPPNQWADRFAYTMLVLPRKGAKVKYAATSRRFGINHAVVYSYLRSLAKKGNVVRRATIAGLATMLDIDAKTVTAITEDLQRLRLIDREDLGGSSDITLLETTDEHLALFAPKPQSKLVVPVEKMPRPAPAPYQLKGDAWDNSRKFCDGLMPQRAAESAIRKAIELHDAPDDFETHLAAAKEQHDKNVLSGKVGKGNFGAYFNKRLQTRLDAHREKERQELAQHQWEEYVKSPAYQAKERETRQAAVADPLHPRHVLSVESITARVQFSAEPVGNYQQADRLFDKVSRHCHLHICGKRLLTQDSVDQSAALRSGVWRSALARLNHYYQQPTLGTPKELQEAIDVAMQQYAPDMKPMFGGEVGHDTALVERRDAGHQ